MTPSTLTAAAENAFRAWLKFCPRRGVEALLAALESSAWAATLTTDAFVRDFTGVATKTSDPQCVGLVPVGSCCPAAYPLWAADPSKNCGEVQRAVEALRRTVSPAAFHMQVDNEGLDALRGDIARVVRDHLGLPPARKEAS